MSEAGPPALLIDPAVLAARLGDPALVIVDCRFRLTDPAAGPAAWASGHIPGALYADLDRDLSGPKTATSGRHPLPEPDAFAAWVARLGIGPGITVVAYDDAGGQMAARLWWLLKWLGHADVLLLDGGLPAWTAAGLPLSTAAPVARPAAPPYRPGHMPALATSEVEASLGTGRWLLLDARSAARFRGEEEPIDPVAGHVPGARSAPFTDMLDASGRFRAPEDLRRWFDGLLDGRPPEAVATMCGSGITGCHTLFAMALAGLPGGSLYAGSWSEWIRSAARPVARGHG